MPLPIAIDYRPALLSRAGIGRATRELARGLSACEELDVHLFGHSLARARVPHALPGRAQLHRLPIPGRTLPWLRRLGIGAERLAGNARVCHWTDYIQPSAHRARTVLTVHDLAFVRDTSWHGDAAATLRQRTATAIEAADALVVPSQTTANDVRAFAPGAPEPLVVPFGSDHVPQKKAPHPLAGRDYALCVGTIEPRKNHRRLLAAWRLLPEPRPLLVVVGAVGWACDEIVRDLDEAVQQGLVQWLPQCPDQQMWPLLQNARLLAYPSLWEGFGFPPLEAMALGVPVVAHDTEPLRELGGGDLGAGDLGDGDLGDGALTLTDANDVEALAATFERVLHDDEHRSQKVSRGIARAAQFSWRAAAQAHAKLYCEVAR